MRVLPRPSCSRSTRCSGSAPPKAARGWRTTSVPLEDACLLAVAVDDASYRTVKEILTAGTERQATRRARPGMAVRPRGPAALRTLVAATEADAQEVPAYRCPRCS